MVRGRSDPDGPPPALRPGHPRPGDRARHRDHRHAPPRGGGAGGRVARCRAVLRRGHARGRARLVRRLPPLDDHRQERDRGARREEQPRDVLGVAGGGFCPAGRQRRGRSLLPGPVQDRPAAEPDGRGRQLPRGAAAHETVRVLALQPRGDGRPVPAPVVPAGRPLELHAPRWARHAARDAVHCALRPRQEELAEAAGRDVRPRVADAAGEPSRRWTAT